MNPKARTSHLEVSRIDDELYVLDLNTSDAHHLHPVTALVWYEADGTRSIADLLTLVRAELGTDATEETIWQALDALGDANLLETRVAPPSGAHRLSRRDLIKRTSAVAAGLSTFAVSPLLASSGNQVEQKQKESTTKKQAEENQKEQAAKQAEQAAKEQDHKNNP